MGCELWALDPEAGEAILREEERWNLAAMDRKWQPVEIESPQGILEWSLSRAVVPVGREYSSRDEAVIIARQVCRTAWLAGITSPAEIDGIIGIIEAERVQRHTGDPAEWSRRFPEINQAALELDRYFQTQGCTVEESLDMICRTLQKLRERGDWRQTDLKLRLVLRRLAGAVFRETRERPKSPFPPTVPLSDYERKRLARELSNLPSGDLEILTCWADHLREEAIAILLRASEVEVRHALKAAFEVLGRSAEEMRGKPIAQLCKEILQRPL